MEPSAHRTSPTHKYIGFTIGILGLLVSAVVIYGVGGPLFPPKKLTQAAREKGHYENLAPYVASKYKMRQQNGSVMSFCYIAFQICFAELHILTDLCWLFAVFSVSLQTILLWEN